MNIRIQSYLVLLAFLLFSISSCVQKTKKQEVSFKIDCRNIDDLNSISVRGSIPPLNWNKNYGLIDPNNDSIYTGKIEFDIPFDFIEIKFVKNEDEFELNDQPNRKLYFDEDQETVYEAVFDKANDKEEN